MTNTTWARETTDRVATEVRRLRGDRTVQWLSDRTEALGHFISRSRLSDLERGDRGGLLGVAELLVLAEALEMQPSLLLYPLHGAGEPVQALPKWDVSPWVAFRWFTGTTGPAAGRDVVALFTEHEGRLTYIPAVRDQGFTFTTWGDTALVEETVMRGQRAEDALLNCRFRMREVGLTPPPLPIEFTYLADRELELHRHHEAVTASETASDRTAARGATVTRETAQA